MLSATISASVWSRDYKLYEDTNINCPDPCIIEYHESMTLRLGCKNVAISLRLSEKNQ